MDEQQEREWDEFIEPIRGHWEGPSEDDLDELKAHVSRLMEEARREGRNEGLDDLYDRINEYVGAKENPDYQLPDGEKLLEMLEAAREK